MALLRKIEVWWVKEVEIPTDPDFNDQEINEDGIVPGRLMSLQILCDIALGGEKKSRFYFDAFRKQVNPRLTSRMIRSVSPGKTIRPFCEMYE